MSLLSRGLNLLFPPRCPFCRGLLAQPEELLCAECQQTLPWLTGRAAERKVDFSTSCISPLFYRDSAREAVLRFKFSGRKGYAKSFGTLMSQCVVDHWSVQADAVTWAPLSEKRRRQRGYDQGALLAREVGERLNLPVVSTLEKVRHTGPQSRLKTDSARRANALGAYQVRPEGQFSGLRLILVDDVVTSGATLGECCRVLLTGGAKEIYCLTLAQAKNDK